MFYVFSEEGDRTSAGDLLNPKNVHTLFFRKMTLGAKFVRKAPHLSRYCFCLIMLDAEQAPLEMTKFFDTWQKLPWESENSRCKPVCCWQIQASSPCLDNVPKTIVMLSCWQSQFLARATPKESHFRRFVPKIGKNPHCLLRQRARLKYPDGDGWLAEICVLLILS